MNTENNNGKNMEAAERRGMFNTDFASEAPAYIERKRWLFLGLPWTFTKYILKEDVLTIDKGFFKTVEDDCYMYKIVDVKLEVGFLERLAGLGTVVCYTSDTTDKILKLEHIAHSREVKNYILDKSEKMRMKRRTMNTLNLNADIGDLDGDGIE